jgi:hypothetical protein
VEEHRLAQILVVELHQPDQIVGVELVFDGVVLPGFAQVVVGEFTRGLVVAGIDEDLCYHSVDL